MFIQTQKKIKRGEANLIPVLNRGVILEIEPVLKYIAKKKKLKKIYNGHDLEDGKFELDTWEKILHYCGWSGTEIAYLETVDSLSLEIIKT